jgi:ADP-heptose:LPS heptosyltransferase
VRIRISHTGLSLGDELAVTAAVRAYKSEYPDEMVRIVDTPRPEIWANNPSLNWGNLDNDILFAFNVADVLHDGPLAHVFAKQLGVLLQDDTPEIWLTEEERELGVGVESWERTVAVDPGAGWASRRWPHGQFEALVAMLKAEGWTVLEVARRLHDRRLRGAIDLTRYGGIRETASILARCTLYVGNDSGMMHLSAAVGTPQVIVFGAIPWYMRAYKNTTSVYHKVACEIQCATSKSCCRKPGCLDQITPEGVMGAVRTAAAQRALEGVM